MILKRLPLHALHVAHGGKIVPFAGFEMPVQYAGGVMKEHLHTRAGAGLFDVSHMGQVVIRPRSGRIADAVAALEAVIPQDILGLAPGRQRYGFLTNDAGGIIDDLMVANFGDHLFMVVNAGCSEGDVAHLRAYLGEICTVEVLDDRVMIALQGPRAEAVLATLSDTTAPMRFMDAGWHQVAGAPCIVSRSGYTGEDGYEISIPVQAAARIVETLLAHPDVLPIGLGARDSLRLEAGLCLYGHDIDTGTTPVEGALEWAIQKVRRHGGAREGGFPGASVILDQLQKGATRRRVGLRPEGRAPVRAEVHIFADGASDQPIGRVTSGGFGPSVNAPVAMGYVPVAFVGTGTRVFAELRGQRLPMVVTPLPFVSRSFKR